MTKQRPSWYEQEAERKYQERVKRLLSEMETRDEDRQAYKDYLMTLEKFNKRDEERIAAKLHTLRNQVNLGNTVAATWLHALESAPTQADKLRICDQLDMFVAGHAPPWKRGPGEVKDNG